jgi:hypothetical protein
MYTNGNAMNDIVKQRVTSKASAPSPKQMLKGFGKAALDHALAGLPKTPTEELAKRNAICEVCEHFGREGKWENRCKLCGCFMKVKAKWAEQHCKINKW